MRDDSCCSHNVAVRNFEGFVASRISYMLAGWLLNVGCQDRATRAWSLLRCSLHVNCANSKAAIRFPKIAPTIVAFLIWMKIGFVFYVDKFVSADKICDKVITFFVDFWIDMMS